MLFRGYSAIQMRLSGIVWTRTQLRWLCVMQIGRRKSLKDTTKSRHLNCAATVLFLFFLYVFFCFPPTFLFCCHSFFFFCWGSKGRLNRCESVCVQVQRVPCLSLLCPDQDHPSFPDGSPPGGPKAPGVHQHMLGTHRGPNLISEAREMEPSSKRQRAKEEK